MLPPLRDGALLILSPHTGSQATKPGERPRSHFSSVPRHPKRAVYGRQRNGRKGKQTGNRMPTAPNRGSSWWADLLPQGTLIYTPVSLHPKDAPHPRSSHLRTSAGTSHCLKYLRFSKSPEDPHSTLCDPCNIWNTAILRKKSIIYLKFRFHWASCMGICISLPHLANLRVLQDSALGLFPPCPCGPEAQGLSLPPSHFI